MLAWISSAKSFFHLNNDQQVSMLIMLEVESLLKYYNDQ